MASRAPAFLLRHSCGFDAPSLSAAPCAAVRRRRIGPTAPSPPRRRPAFIPALIPDGRRLLVAEPRRPQAPARLARLELGIGVALAGARFPGQRLVELEAIGHAAGDHRAAEVAAVADAALRDDAALAIEARRPAFHLVVGLGQQVGEEGPRPHARYVLDPRGVAQLGRLDAPDAQMRLEPDATQRLAVDGEGLAVPRLGQLAQGGALGGLGLLG